MLHSPSDSLNVNPAPGVGPFNKTNAFFMAAVSCRVGTVPFQGAKGAELFHFKAI
jgi:hypothetical protein